MKRSLACLIAGALLASVSGAPGAPPRPARIKRPGEWNVLFVGNSYTMNMSALFKSMCSAAGKRGKVDSVVFGGLQLKGHLDRGEAARRIAEGGWDIVVLQEQSQTAAFPVDQAKQVMDPAVAKFKALCADIGATPVLFAHWAKKNGDRDNFPNDTYEADRDRLNVNFERVSTEQGVALIPVGRAWDDVRREHPNIKLYADDGTHPSAAGAYLAACVFYSAFFKEQPTRSPAPPGVNAPDGAILRAAAWAAVTKASSGAAPARPQPASAF